MSDLPIYSPSYLQVIVPDLIIVACAGYNEEVLAQLRSFCLPSDVALVQENSISLLKNQREVFLITFLPMSVQSPH